jgi:trans-aconitate 2-methyltransferase
MRWDPTLYGGFAAPRLRPALDLLARVPLEAPRRIADLGCGGGQATRLLAQRWPAAELSGIDSSPDMLAEAAAKEPASRTAWVRCDVAAWTPAVPLDLIFSNAALHWLDDHATLFPRLLDMLAPGGVLAVQMPRNHGAPSHTGMAEAALAGPWAETLRPLLRPSPVGSPELYYDLLAPRASRLDLWETEYLHVLEGDDPVVTWTSATALAPLLQALEGDARSAFLDDYRARMAKAYPRRPDGRTLLPFRRLFLVAERA